MKQTQVIVKRKRVRTDGADGQKFMLWYVGRIIVDCEPDA